MTDEEAQQTPAPDEPQTAPTAVQQPPRRLLHGGGRGFGLVGAGW